MNISMIRVSQDALGDTGKKTRLRREEFVVPYQLLKDAEANVTLAPPKAGLRSIGPRRDVEDTQTVAAGLVKSDKDAQRALTYSSRMAVSKRQGEDRAS